MKDIVEIISATKNAEARKDQRNPHLQHTKESKFFMNIVDELVEFAQYDPELDNGIKWLDKKAGEKGIDFYDMVFEVLYKHNTDEKAKDWLNSRN